MVFGLTDEQFIELVPYFIFGMGGLIITLTCLGVAIA